MSRSGLGSAGGIGRGVNKFLNWFAPASGFLAAAFQATSSDRAYAEQNGLLNSFTGTQKAEQWINWLVSRFTFGQVTSVFSGVYPGNKPSFNIANVFNKYTGGGIAALIYAMIPGLPARGKVRKFSLPLMAGGVIGGLFDDPAGQVRAGIATGLNRSGGVLPQQTITRGGATGGGGISSSNLNRR